MTLIYWYVVGGRPVMRFLKVPPNQDSIIGILHSWKLKIQKGNNNP